MSMTAAVTPWTPHAIDLAPPLRSTMIASAIGIMVAANISQPTRWVAPLTIRTMTNRPYAMSRTPLALK